MTKKDPEQVLREGLATKPRSGSATVSPEEWRDAYGKEILLIRDLLLSSESKKAALNLNERLATELGTTLKTLGKKVKDNVVVWETASKFAYQGVAFRTNVRDNTPIV
jgi:hypothetical protein